MAAAESTSAGAVVEEGVFAEDGGGYYGDGYYGNGYYSNDYYACGINPIPLLGLLYPYSC